MSRRPVKHHSNVVPGQPPQAGFTRPHGIPALAGAELETQSPKAMITEQQPLALFPVKLADQSRQRRVVPALDT